ncbi:hypothetical protein FPV67DRAFT_1714403 [Lyophyllum atratum]|nr:hypothetical protein FPV67DRAFT_1677978 [Lyophyllum atratum]KAF8076629.1 hypothetical protein FPV67DRAFT_1714403 [Lyophyllum atratum]
MPPKKGAAKSTSKPGPKTPAKSRGKKARNEDHIEGSPDLEEAPTTRGKTRAAGQAAAEASKLDWTEKGLTEKLIASITDDKDIKQGLFPSPGAHASTTHGGGRSKTDWHWDLAVLVFEAHAKYGPSIQAVVDAQKTNPKTASKLRNAWAEKIKNRLKRMGEITRGYMAEMGETGAGIVRESDIDMTQDNKLTNKWKAIKEICPWFFDMKDLIAERPNLVPTGIGHSGTEIEMSALATGDGEVEIIGEIDISDDNSPADDDDDLPHPSLLAAEALATPKLPPPTHATPIKPEVSDITVAGNAKRKLEEALGGKTPARAGTSKPAVPGKPPAKKSKMEEFTAIAQAEEVSRQKELDLARTKVEAAARVKVESEKAILQAKLAMIESKKEERADKRRVKHEAKMEKMRLQHELQLARLRQQNITDLGPSTSSHASATPSSQPSLFTDMSISDASFSTSSSSSANGVDDWEALAPYGMFLPSSPHPGTPYSLILE